MDRKKFIRTSAMLALGTTATQLAAANRVQPAGAVELLVNAGIGGNTTNNLLQRIDKDCLAHNPTLTIKTMPWYVSPRTGSNQTT